MRKIKDYLIISLKGVAMGSADVVPGVSGGTIAFISGIYEELINTIKGVEPKLLRVLFKEGFAPFWKALNGSWFLVRACSRAWEYFWALSGGKLTVRLRPSNKKPSSSFWKSHLASPFSNFFNEMESLPFL